ncbi:MAG: FMN-dependent NADH-azoreductase [Methylocystaceae bacterium]|nr:MAG: FMN-dependent NADH-azoreductase [Methylocystaceae bacterium]
MTRLLHIDSSILGEQSLSRRLSADIVAKLRGENPGLEVVYRDVAATPPPHLSGAYFAARAGGEAPFDQSLRDDLARGERLLDEFLSADIVVIGAPMYNFSVPAQLKSWIDHLVVLGKTFAYTANGIEGLVHGKRVIVASTRGGIYNAAPREAHDHQEAYLRSVFVNIGVKDFEVVRAEGIGLGEAQKNEAVETARRGISALRAA